MKKFITVVVGVVVLGASVVASAYGPGGHKMGYGFYSDMKFAVLEEVADLTPEQKIEIDAIREEVKGRAKAYLKKKKMETLHDLDPMASDYDKRVKKLAKAKAKKVEAYIIAKGEVRAKIYQVLTPEQQEKINAFRKKMHESKMKHKLGQSSDNGEF